MTHKQAAGAAFCLAFALAGCATRGAQDIDCARFDDYTESQRPTGIVADIQLFAPQTRTSGATGGESMRAGALEDLLRREILGQRSAPRGKAATQAQSAAAHSAVLVERYREPRNLLLLSGGGQWGAYGAGLFLGMACAERLAPRSGARAAAGRAGGGPLAPADRNVLPCMAFDEAQQADPYTGEYRSIKADHIDFARLDAMNIGVITGVSTGALQSLLLVIVLDPAQPKTTRIAALQQLLDSYAPGEERHLVDRDSFLEAVLKGSLAGTAGLRRHVTQVLEKPFELQAYTDGGAAGPLERRRLIDQLGASRIAVLFGFVEGTDGRFKYVNARDLVRSARDHAALARFRGEALVQPGPDKPTRCVLAATLASAAMPVFHQQLRVRRQTASGAVRPLTLFDGGVRRSVFLGRLGELFRQDYAERVASMTAAERATARRDGRLPRIFVLRNGPTSSKPGTGIDEVAGAQPQALRAYGLMVNELEVGSIAALRLAHPFGPIDVSTADGAEDHEPGAPLGEDGLPLDPLARRGCGKQGEQMFSPRFMRCLQNFGARRAMAMAADSAREDGIAQTHSLAGFWPLRPVEQPPRPLEEREMPQAGGAP